MVTKTSSITTEDTYCCYCGDNLLMGDRVMKLTTDKTVYSHVGDCWAKYTASLMTKEKTKTVNEIAKQFGVTVRTIYRWRNNVS